MNAAKWGFAALGALVVGEAVLLVLQARHSRACVPILDGEEGE